MSKLTIISLFILSITSTFLLLIHYHQQNPLIQELTTHTSISDDRKCPFHKLFHCPTSSSYPQSCLSNIIPPWPICLTKNVTEWYNVSKDSSTRCCKDNGDLSECKCPHKDSAKFLDKIGDWCEGVKTCDDKTRTDY